jgi:proteasome lid subunit RPN8/RPN11
MRLEISSSVLIGIREISAVSAPLEACGLLFGTDGRIDAFQAVENVSETPDKAFEIDPRALFAALRAERAGGPRIVGYWHSHPSGDASPSATDAAMARADGKLWLIVAADGMALWRPVEQKVYGWSDGDPRAKFLHTVIGFDRVPMVTGDIRDLLPHDKCDEAMVPLLAEAGYPAVAPYLDELLEWTFDGNWPIALPMADFLAALGAPMLDPIRRVLGGEDDGAKWAILALVVQQMDPGVRGELVETLRRLATAPSVGERQEGVDALARELLTEWQC